MFQEKVPDEVIKYVEKLLKDHNFGQRGYADGDYSEQKTGLIGQTLIQDLFNIPRPDGSEGFDGGVDFIFGSKNIDVKTMGRTVDPKLSYVNNFIGLQKEYNSDILIFCSLNKNTNILTICGWISKEDFLKKASFFKSGTKRYRDDGTYFYTKAELYEIENSLLNQSNSIQDLKAGIKKFRVH